MRHNRIYILLISTIIGLILINQTINNYKINQQKYDGTAINYAGLQRMLSQNISKNVLKINDKFENSLPSDIERKRGSLLFIYDTLE